MKCKFKVGDKVQFTSTSIPTLGTYVVDALTEDGDKIYLIDGSCGYAPEQLRLVEGCESIITPPLSECNERSLISMDKKYTCNGKPMRVLCVDRTGEGTSSAVVAMHERSGVITYFDKYGNNILKCCSNLVEVRDRIKRTVWVNVYPNTNSTSVHASKADAERVCRLACVKLVIDVEEGEGL